MKTKIALIFIVFCLSFAFSSSEENPFSGSNKSLKKSQKTNHIREQYTLPVPDGIKCRGAYSGCDVNQNGLYEIILTSYEGGGTFHVFEITQNNTAVEIWKAPFIGSSNNLAVRDVKVGDLDNNGDYEIIVSVNGLGGVDDDVMGLLIYEYTKATESFDEPYHTIIDTNALNDRIQIEGFDVFDVDRDGKQEILVSNNGSISDFDSVYIISFEGTFDDTATQVMEFSWGKNGNPALGGSALNATHADMDGDGHYEAVFGIWDHAALLIAESTGQNQYQVRKYIHTDETRTDGAPIDNIISYDLDENGRDEIYLTIYGGDNDKSLKGVRCIADFESMTEENSVYMVAPPGQAGGFGIAAADLDKDGNVSLFTSAYGVTVTEHEYIGGDITDTTNYIPSAISGLSIEETFGLSAPDVDLDGDGFPELVITDQGSDDAIGASIVEDLSISGITEPQNLELKDFILYQNYPNPFNPMTKIQFYLPKASDIHLSVYNILGQRIKTLMTGVNYKAGIHEVMWYGEDQFGKKVPSGTYIYQLKAGGYVKSRTMLLIR